MKWAYLKGFDEIVDYLRSCFDDETEVLEFETPSPIGRIRMVTQGSLFSRLEEFFFFFLSFFIF